MATTAEVRRTLASAVEGKPLSEQSWEQLLQARKEAEGDPAKQAVLAPFEHRAYAREYVRDNPLAAPGMAMMTPAYYAAKKMGLANGRTEADVDQVMAGWQGTAEGLMDYFKKRK